MCGVRKSIFDFEKTRRKFPAAFPDEAVAENVGRRRRHCLQKQEKNIRHIIRRQKQEICSYARSVTGLLNGSSIMMLSWTMTMHQEESEVISVACATTPWA